MKNLKQKVGKLLVYKNNNLGKRLLSTAKETYWFKRFLKSGLFDPSFYRASNSDLRELTDRELFVHYFYTGFSEGRNPSSLFNTKDYLELRFDVLKSGVNPLLHFLKFGVNEGMRLDSLGYILEEPEPELEPAPCIAKNKHVETIAYYLPQFHSDSFNNKFWGQGFTEWVNVVNAKKLDKYHNQPNLPLHGYYNLNDIECIRNQCKLAKEFGIDGFNLMVFEFEGGKRPLRSVLHNIISVLNEYGMKYVFEWANEPWTRRWDGLDNDVLLEQDRNCSESVCNSLADTLFEYMQSPNYMKMNGKPALLIYRPQYFTAESRHAIKLRNAFERYFKEGVELGAMLTFREGDDEGLGMFESNSPEYDFLVQYPPHRILTKKVELNDASMHNVHDYKGTVLNYIDQIVLKTKKQVIPCVFPSWDNTPRKKSFSDYYASCTSKNFKKWLSSAYDYAIDTGYNDKYVFINSWNEWAEGAHLEPCQKLGYYKLNAFADVHDNINLSFAENFKSSLSTGNGLAAFGHMFSTTNLNTVIRLSQAYPQVDFHLTYNAALLGKEIYKSTAVHDAKNVMLYPVSNRGRDYRFVSAILPHIKNCNYRAVCKFHFKTRNHKDGQSILNHTAESLIEDHLKCLINTPIDVVNTVWGKRDWVVSQSTSLGSNEANLRKLCNIHNLNFDKLLGTNFVSGGFFVTNMVKTLVGLDSDAINDLFEFDSGRALDGLMPHALERFIYFMFLEGGAKVEFL